MRVHLKGKKEKDNKIQKGWMFEVWIEHLKKNWFLLIFKMRLLEENIDLLSVCLVVIHWFFLLQVTLLCVP